MSNPVFYPARKGTTMTDTQPAPTTTDAGIPIESDEHSLTIGPDGPILLHDHYLIEHLAQFNRERVPSGSRMPRVRALLVDSR